MPFSFGRVNTEFLLLCRRGVDLVAEFRGCSEDSLLEAGARPPLAAPPPPLPPGPFAGPPAAASGPTITLDKTTVSWGDTVNVTVTGLDATKGYYLLFCESQPKQFPICVKNGKNPKSHLRVNNNVTDKEGVRIDKQGVARSPLEITKKDTTLTGPVPNPFVTTCAAGNPATTAPTKESFP